MKPEAKAVGRRKRPRFPRVVSKKDKSPKKKSGRATRSSGRGSKPSKESSSSSSSSGGGEPAPAPAPAPADGSSDAESPDEELPDGFKKEYHPEAMLAARQREAEVIRRERLSAKRRKKADKVALPAVPEDPVPPQRGGFPTDDWPEDGFPAWFVEQCQKFGHDLDDEANVDALERMVAIFRAVDVRPYVPGRYIACDAYIENLAVLAQHVDKEKADALKKAIKDLCKLDRECREADREEERPKGACPLCAVVGGYVVTNSETCNDITIHKTRVQLVDNRLKVTDLRDPYDLDDPGNADHVLDHLKFCPRLRLWVCSYCNTNLIVLLDMLDNESVADLFWRDWQLAFFYKQG